MEQAASSGNNKTRVTGTVSVNRINVDGTGMHQATRTDEDVLRALIMVAMHDQSFGVFGATE
jgi:hypothetical protein